MLNFLRDTATKAVASTGLGKSLVIKPTITGHITKARAKLAEYQGKFSDAKVLQKSPALKILFEDFVKKSHAFLNDIEKPETMDPIVEVVAKVLVNYPSKESVKEHLQKSVDATALREFVLSLIDFNQYQAFIDQLQSIEDIEKMSVAEQRTLYRSLSDSTLTDQMQKDLQKLDIEGVKQKTKLHGEPACKHFSLTAEDAKIVMGIFDKVTAKHLPGLKVTQATLATHLPEFIKIAKAHIELEYPEIAIVSAAPILTMAREKQAANQGAVVSAGALANEEKKKSTLGM